MVFVTNQLLPLAEVDVIHPDIRAGYDFTSNIMAKEDGKDMVLIDFESLVDVSVYREIHMTDERYFRVSRSANALTFVCFQCYAVAVFWSKQRKQAEEDKTKQAKTVIEDFRKILGEKTASDVTKLLNDIASLFDGNDSPEFNGNALLTGVEE